MYTPRGSIETELLVLDAQLGNQDALAALVEREHDNLTRRALALTQSHDAAPDIVQDTWVAIARNIRKLRDPARFHAWASAILANHARDWIKSQTRQRHAIRHHHHAPAPETTHADRSHEVRLAILTLDPKLRDIVILVHMDRCTIEQAAAALAIPAGTAKSRLRKARHRLRTTLELERT